MTLRLFSLFSVLALTACISGQQTPDSYTDHTGKTTVFRTDQETCVQSCNEDYSRCMDSDFAHNNKAVNGAPGVFGVSADCKNSLRDCLPTCKGQ